MFFFETLLKHYFSSFVFPLIWGCCFSLSACFLSFFLKPGICDRAWRCRKSCFTWSFCIFFIFLSCFCISFVISLILGTRHSLKMSKLALFFDIFHFSWNFFCVSRTPAFAAHKNDKTWQKNGTTKWQEDDNWQTQTTTRMTKQWQTHDHIVISGFRDSTVLGNS